MPEISEIEIQFMHDLQDPWVVEVLKGMQLHHLWVLTKASSTGGLYLTVQVPWPISGLGSPRVIWERRKSGLTPALVDLRQGQIPFPL